MADKLTLQQQMAVENRGGKLLVSAAAGSGKTKVLVDRLMRYLLDPQDPANMDDFLMITYTKAAASELREKIASKLTERIAQMPENRHLHRQIQRLFLTKISTVHGFCGDILREFAYRLDLPGDFRVADENECYQLRELAMESVLKDAYERPELDPDFVAFLDTQGLGRDDRLVPEILMKIFDSAQCHLDPEAWLEQCYLENRISGCSDAGETVWGKYLIEDLYHFLDGHIQALTRCADRAERTEEMEKPAALLRQTVKQLEQLRNCVTWDQIVECREIDFGRLVFSKKCPDMELAERIKAIRSACKKGLEKRLKCFTDNSEVVLSDLQNAARSTRGMIALVRRFSAEYSHLKRNSHVLDFGDLEHKMLDLLYGPKRMGLTSAAMEIGNRFREILIDEYQDSNEVQDAIFSALTEQRQNCFMVGDVKQSIYQFRLADPGIFLKKYDAYLPAEEAGPRQGRKVLLNSNFRSGSPVLAAVNDVFQDCMSQTVGGLDYTEQEMLREGLPHLPLGETEVELYGIQVQETTYEEEAGFVANHIHELLNGTHMVRQGEELRPIVPDDIVILLRSPGSVGMYFRQALEKVGLRCCSGGGVNLLETEEVGTLRALLQTVNNPTHDIPLLATLASPVFGFTANDLAEIRTNSPGGSFYDALKKDPGEKTKRFLEILSELRETAKTCSLIQLLQKVFYLTKMDSLYGAMQGGETRKSYLQLFYRLAGDFESAGRRDLGQFLEHLSTMDEKGLIAAEAQTSPGCVTLMSIHKSKGLEFPVVFLCGLSREFNRESSRAQVLCDKELGLGLSAVDGKNRVRYPTIAKRAIAARMTAESLSEELRVLYVAMTRARDRLIMTYAGKNLETHLSDLALRLDLTPREILTQDVVCPGEWVLLSALRRTEAGALFAISSHPDCAQVRDIPWKIQVVTGAELETEKEAAVPQQTVLSTPVLDTLKASLAFHYPYEKATKAPSKQTATQLKGRSKDQEAAENSEPEPQMAFSWRRPSFIEQQIQGTTYGNAVHGVMQYLNFSVCGTVSGVKTEVERLVRERFITEEQGKLIPCQKIAALFASDLGKKLMHGEILREFKFSILDEGDHFDPELAGERILLQGVVDCALLEPDGVTIIDFKTDHVTEETIDAVAMRYQTQVETYANAMSRITQKAVKARYLYFFHMDCFYAL